MQKQFFVLAVAAVISVPAVADVQVGPVIIYGKADLSYDQVKTGVATNGTPGISQSRVSSNSTYIGFKGQEGFEGGVAVVWQIESTVLAGNSGGNGTTNNGYLGTRNTYLGLASADVGTVLAGRYDTPYKLSTRRLDQFTDGIADNRSIMGGGTITKFAGTALAPVNGFTSTTYNGALTSFDNRQDNAIAYISPSWSGVTVAVVHANLSVGSATQINSPASAAGTNNQSITSMAVWYDANGVFATAAYEVHDNFGFVSAALPVQIGESAAKVGFGYTRAGIFSLGVEAERTSDNAGPNNSNLLGHNAYYVGGRYYFTPANYVKIAYARAGSESGVAKTGARQISLGFDHDLSKTTAVYVLYSQISNEANAAYSFANVASASTGGSSGSATSSTLTGAGASPSVLAVGLRKTF